MFALLKHPVAQASGLRVVAVVLGVASSVTIARLGGAEIKGISSAFTTAASLLFVIINLDLAQQVLRHAQSSGRLNEARGAIGRLWLWYMPTMGFSAGVSFLVGSEWAAWVSLGALAYLMATQLGYTSNGLSGPAATAWGALIQQGVLIAGTAGAWAVGLLNADSIRGIITLSFLAPLMYYWRKSGTPASGQHRDHSTDGERPDGYVRPRILQLLRSGSQWQIARVCQFLLLRLDTLIVFAALGARAAGIYSVGLATASLAGIVPSQFASNATYEATRGIDSSLRLAMIRTALAGSIGAVALAVLSWPLIRYVYGNEYTDAYLVAVLCLPGVVAFAVIQLYTNRIRVLGRASDVTIPSSIGAAVMVLTLLALTPIWDTAGAALASSSGSIAAMLVVVLRSMRSDT